MSIASKHWSIETALEQIDKCDFECEGGPLANNAAYRWLKAAAQVGPQFWPGQGVWFEVVAEVGGIKIGKWVHVYIIGCAMSSDTERRLWTYSISVDPPAPWHYGTLLAAGIAADKLRLVNPDTERAAA